MSLRLEIDTYPTGVETKSNHGIADIRGIRIGDYDIGEEDFSVIVLYWLTNTDLLPGDKRLKLIEDIKNLKIEKGYSEGRNRLALRSKDET